MLLLAVPASAQQVASSPAPDRVAVTVYRDPGRSADRAMNLRWLNGFAFVTETRTVRIPAGEVDIRFEGVAGNILPQSAIVTGLPDEVLEKNQDAYLLSPSSLIERSLGRRVHLRRTSRATGEVREHEAVIRSGADGALVLQTEDGFEALRCTGLAETVIYESVPEGLSPRPVLSVRTRSTRETTATVTLSYLASGFDWQANYVASLSSSGDRIDLFAWLTLASMDETSFPDADTQAVAGRLNYSQPRRQPRTGGAVNLRCWPSGTTSDIELEEQAEDLVVTGSRLARMAMAPPPPPPPPPPAPQAAMEAQQEELGDVKLYRIPEPVTVASNGQKQVAFLQRAAIPVTIVHRQRVWNPGRGWQPARRVLVARNEARSNLGVPLPAGRLVLFAQGAERPILIGEGSLADRAVGEEVEVELGPATGVRSELTELPDRTFELAVANDQARPVRFEAELPQRAESSTRLGRRNGRPLWTVTIPANARVSLRYRVPAEG